MTGRSVPRTEFTREMKKTHVILMPGMMSIHFRLVHAMFARHGLNVEVLANDGREVIDTGLKYVHNDTCYPALLCIGQLMNALESGKYDPDQVALMLMQTGGGCRASNYIYLLRKALVKAGLTRVPVVSLNMSNLEKQSGFHMSPPVVVDSFCLLLYGDMLMLLENQVKPYEENPGDAERATDMWIDKLRCQLRRFGGMPYRAISRNLKAMARDYEKIPVKRGERPRVGIVGEIYLKYSALANNHLSEFLTEQGCEVMTPGIISYMTFMVDNKIEDINLYGGGMLKKAALKCGLAILKRCGGKLHAAIKGTRFTAPMTFDNLKKSVNGVLGYGNKMGEGWMLPAEIIELIGLGFTNIVCAQPFGCLPNHVVGRGVLAKLRGMYPEANITPIDYDPGATRVNQINRIKLMLAISENE